jgi:hypothetical protein
MIVLWLMKKIVIFTFVTLIFFALMGTTYYFTFQLPTRKNLELEIEKARIDSQKNQDRNSKIDNCLTEALKTYTERWKKNCDGKNIETNENGSCALSSNLAVHLDQEYKNLRDECLARYSY